MGKKNQQAIFEASFETPSAFAENKVRFSPFTAIIGENLSGKSKLLEEISNALASPDDFPYIRLHKNKLAELGGLVCEREILSETEKKVASLVVEVAQKKRKPRKTQVEQVADEIGLSYSEKERFFERLLEAIEFFGRHIPLTSHKGDFTQSISVQLITKYSLFLKGGIPVFLIEEPEMHLHPQSQMHIRKVLLRFSSVAQILMTTHSPYMLVGLPWHWILKVNPFGIKPRICQISLDFISKKTEFPKRLSAELAASLFARVVFLVEGETERIAIPIFASKMLKDQRSDFTDLVELSVQVLPIHGNNFRPYLHLFSEKGFAIPWVALTDSDSAENLYRTLRSMVSNLTEKTPGRRRMRSILQKYNCFIMQENFEKDFLYRNPTLVELVARKYFPEDWKLIKAQSKSLKERKALLLRVMKRNKPRFAQALATEARIDEIPPAIRKAINSIHQLSLKKTLDNETI